MADERNTRMEPVDPAGIRERASQGGWVSIVTWTEPEEGAVTFGTYSTKEDAEAVTKAVNEASERLPDLGVSAVTDRLAWATPDGAVESLFPYLPEEEG